MSVNIVHDIPTQCDAKADLVIIGAGACGLIAALMADFHGADVLVLERDAQIQGSTALSSGFIPAGGTTFQHAQNMTDDSEEIFLADIMAKNKNTGDSFLAQLAVDNIAPALEFLAEHYGFEWVVLDEFLYPGHRKHRMHTLVEKTGAAIMARLINSAEAANIPIVTEARAETLYCDAQHKCHAVGAVRPDGGYEIIHCQAVLLACNGYGGNEELVREYIPEIAEGVYYGHAGNTGDAVQWGQKLGAKLQHLSGYQGHGSIAHPHGILISWALMGKGAFQINKDGVRFADESGGYSEHSLHVISQRDHVAWNIYDAAIHEFAQTFPDYKQAMQAGAIYEADILEALAAKINVSKDTFAETLKQIESCKTGTTKDKFGRDFTHHVSFAAPFYAVKITGALFHTQGGLMIDEHTRVVAENGGTPLPNLYAAGGAACGVSGPHAYGYLSGNGLLTALAFGALAGEKIAKKMR